MGILDKLRGGTLSKYDLLVAISAVPDGSTFQINRNMLFVHLPPVAGDEAMPNGRLRSIDQAVDDALKEACGPCKDPKAADEGK